MYQRTLRVSVVLVSLLAVAGCERKLDIDAPPPAVTADTDTLPSLPTSTLDIPFWLFAAPMLVGFALAALGYIWFALRRQDPPLGGGTQI